MENFISIASSIWLKDAPHDGVYVDFTITDGYDTLYIAQYVSEGNVVAFESGVSNAESVYALLEDNFQNNAHIVADDPINVEKYVTESINGFYIDAVKTDISASKLIELINTGLSITKKNMRGMVIVDKYMSEVTSYISSLEENKVKVMSISMANVDAPCVYIMEKLTD